MAISSTIFAVLCLFLLLVSGAPAPSPAPATTGAEAAVAGGYWLESIARQGTVAYGTAGYQVFRNVKDFGAKGDGSTDDTAAINSAITAGSRCGQGCDSTTVTPAIVYFPAGTYSISAPLIQYYYTQFVGDATNLPIIKATAGFQGMALMDADPYADGGVNWYTNQNNFFRQIRNFVLDTLPRLELADALNLGPKFYLIGFSLGGHAVWASLKYIPGRLAGVALLAPVINYRWPGFPKDLSWEFYKKQDIGDQWTLRVAYYAPWLLHWWINQSWLPSSTVIKGTTKLPNRLDLQIRDDLMSTGAFLKRRELATQQSLQESYLRDLAVMFGKWEFDPMDLPQPSFPVHLWQGDEDGLVPVGLQRYICRRLGWIEYHELPSTGHYLSRVPGLVDRVLESLLESST